MSNEGGESSQVSDLESAVKQLRTTTVHVLHSQGPIETTQQIHLQRFKECLNPALIDKLKVDVLSSSELSELTKSQADNKVIQHLMGKALRDEVRYYVAEETIFNNSIH